MAKVPRVRYAPNKIEVGYAGVNFRYPYSLEALVQSHGHTRKGSGWSGGGPFFVYKDSYSDVNQRVLEYTHNGNKMRTIMVATGLPTTFSPPTIPSWSSVESAANSFYATGYKRTRPGRAVAGVGQFLVELRQLPQIPLRNLLRLRTFRALGGEYLNAQFGWVPFVSDLQKMYNLYHTLDTRLNTLREQNGQKIRRRVNLMDETSSTQSTASSSNSAGFTYFDLGPSAQAVLPSTGSGTMTTTTTTRERVWYSSRMQYWVPDIGSPQWTRRATRALFGANPTPEVLWEVLPWSWLIDYFTNAGDVISNMSSNAVDNLVLDYSFVMREKTVITERVCRCNWPRLSIPGTGTFVEQGEADLRWKRTVVTKSRSGTGNPYGLGVTAGSLSGFQWSILAALGISRQRLL